MRKVLLLLCVAAMLQSVASAAVVGSWAKRVDSGFDIWTLTCTPNAGEVMGAFDLTVYATGDTTFNQNGLDFATTLDDYTHWLFQKKHGVGAGTPDTAYVGDGVDAGPPGDLYGTASFYLNGVYDDSHGAGPAGKAGATAVLQISVASAGDPFSVNGNIASGLNGLACTDSSINQTKSHMQYIQDGVFHDIVFTPVPEPCTLALLGCGLLGLLAYAWRKRK